MSFNVLGKRSPLEVVIYLCLFSLIFSEVLLSPYFPQFFAKAFSEERTAFTGLYIFCCRLASIAALPFWGWLSRFIRLHAIVSVCLGISPFICVGMAFLTTAESFLIASMFLVFFKTSIFLLYPYVVQANPAHKEKITLHYQLLFHGAILLSTMAGASIMMWENPQLVFLWVGSLDVVMLVLLWTVRKDWTRSESRKTEKAVLKGRKSLPGSFIIGFGLTILMFHLGHQMIRPYFTLYTEETFQVTTWTSGFLFLLPSLVAVIVIPWLQQLMNKEIVYSVLGVSFALLSFTLTAQGFAVHFMLFLVFRIVYGLFLTIGQAALDASFFRNGEKRNMEFHYSILAVFQNTALLLAPLGAAPLAEQYHLAAPFWAAGLCLIASGLLFVAVMNRHALYNTVKLIIYKSERGREY